MPGQQGPTQERAGNGAGHSTHSIPQPQLWGRETSVQQEERKQAAGALFTCGENMNQGVRLPSLPRPCPTPQPACCPASVLGHRSQEIALTGYQPSLGPA